MRKKTVLVFGTFDIIHPGHLSFLSQAKAHGDKLIVVVARDAQVKKLKDKLIFTEKDRMSLVRSLDMVDKVILGDKEGEWSVIKKVKPDVICVGYDQDSDHEALKAQWEELKQKPKVVRCKAKNIKKWRSRLLKKLC